MRFMADQDSHPRSRRAKWKHETGLASQGPGVSERELIVRALNAAISFDQLSISELATLGRLARRAQLIEHKCRERVMRKPGTEDTIEDGYCMMGAAETRGHLIICPEL